MSTTAIDDDTMTGLYVPRSTGPGEDAKTDDKIHALMNEAGILCMPLASGSSEWGVVPSVPAHSIERAKEALRVAGMHPF